MSEDILIANSVGIVDARNSKVTLSPKNSPSWYLAQLLSILIKKLKLRISYIISTQTFDEL